MLFPTFLGINDIKDLLVRKYNQDILDIRNWWNDHDSGARTWTVMNATTATIANLTVTGSFSIVPSGLISPYGGTAAPTGWLLCDGSAISRTTFASLFTAIGVTWGVGDGSTTFNVPDLRRRTAVGSGGAGTGTLGNAVGNTGGEETHAQSVAEMPAHHHQLVEDNNPGSNTFHVNANLGDAGATTGNFTTTDTGGGTAFNVIQPSAVVLYIIKT